MNKIIKELKIENMIYEIRGKQVMLDSDLAQLYGVDKKRINEAVKRNPDKFPKRFSFVLNIEEEKNLKSQIATSNSWGVAMLTTILKSKVATETSIKIMDAFVSMRKYISSNLIEQKYINNLVMKHEEQINTIFDYFETKEMKNEIYFNGQIYDAYSKILDIFLLAKNKLIIIDSYADKYVLDMISKVDIQVILVLSINAD